MFKCVKDHGGIGGMKKIIIFGAGQSGGVALINLRRENVAYFCDNRRSIVGTYKYGVEIIGFEQMLELLDSHIILIAANDGNAIGNDRYSRLCILLSLG